MKIAIVGTGISGLGAAYLLSKQHDITVYEKNDYLGGHSRTIEIPTGEKQTPVDTGFIVFNDRNYPNLIALFKELNIQYEKSDMSFGVSIDNGWLEYSSSSMFAQTRNILRPAYYGMLFDIFRFNKAALSLIESDSEITLGECLHHLKMNNWFQRYYLLAMGAAIWSCSVETITKFPALTYLRFFKNHGLLKLKDRPQWYTVTGGSQEYVKRLTSNFRDKIKLGCSAKKIANKGNRVSIQDQYVNEQTFDHVILACHANEALNIIEQPTEQEHTILKNFTYQQNKIIAHSDVSFMPRNKKCWSSWVYLSEKREDQKNVVSLSYWMNNLQNLDPNYPIFLTLNPGRRPKEQLIWDEHTFSHPIFDANAIQAQQKLEVIQGKRGLWFCGAYQRYGFHEDGLVSAINVVKKMGGDIPWQ